MVWLGLQDHDWRDDCKGHVCYDPKKDLVIPQFKAPSHFQRSPLFGAPPMTRDVLLYFRGDMGKHRETWYSRGIRQKYFRLSHTHEWRKMHNILIGTGAEYPGDYSMHLARSKFCLVLPGDGYSGRAEDAIMHGCIPVIVMDNVHAVLEGVLDWLQFSVRIAEADIERTPEIISGISDAQILAMQKAITKVWHRFGYMGSPLHRKVLPNVYRQAESSKDFPSDHHFKPHESYPVRSDALGTILQWLYSRMAYARHGSHAEHMAELKRQGEAA
ncbi:hypothetical protein FOA52_008419 [Chlamydomonas sp. UWO 241]|nr:hypothetical protein FOA52_008419 [Chlamydomonas sp. UWO 241]